MTGQRSTLILLHGWGMHSAVWAQTATHLSADFNVIAPDLPGYGGTPGMTPYTLEKLADRLATELPSSCMLCGWSLGGQLAIKLALRMPERVRRLVLIGTNPCFTRRNDWTCAIEPAILAQFSRDLADHYEATLKRFLALQVHGDAAARQTLAHLRSLLLAQRKPDDLTLSGGLQILIDNDLRSQIGDIVAPTLVVHGACDRLVPRCAAEWLASMLPDGHLLTMAAASHAPFLSHPLEFESALRDFLQTG